MVGQLRKLKRVYALQQRNRGFRPEVADECPAFSLGLVLHHPDKWCVEPIPVRGAAENLAFLTPTVRNIALSQCLLRFRALCKLLRFPFPDSWHKCLRTALNDKAAAFIFVAVLYDVDVLSCSAHGSIDPLLRQELIPAYRQILPAHQLAWTQLSVKSG